MRLPTWSEFTAGVSQIENNINDNVQKFRNDHPVLDRAIKRSIFFLSPLFDSIAENIYDSFDGSEEEKSAAVLNYFEYLKSQGEKHYTSVTSQLNNLLDEIQDLKTLTASLVEKIQEILISTGNAANQKLDDLTKDLKEIGIKVDKIDQKADAILKDLSSTLQIVDKVYAQIQIMIGQKPQPYRVIAVQEDDKINLKAGDRVVQTITPDVLSQLDNNSRLLLEAFQTSMQKQFELWTQIYPKRLDSPDQVINAQVDARLKAIAKQIWFDWNNILGYLGQIGIS
jgi:isoleucyl-tRNA synthetase